MGRYDSKSPFENDKLNEIPSNVANPPFYFRQIKVGFAGESNGDFKMEEGLGPLQEIFWGGVPS